MWRGIRIGVYVLVLLGMIWYGKAYNPAISLQTCLQHPERFDGRRIEVATEVTVVQTWPESLLVRQMGKEVKVIGSPGDAAPGDYVSLVALFRAPARLELEMLHPAKGRRAKIIWSALPPLVLAGFWLRSYRFDPRRFYWQERKRCRTW